MFSKVLGQAFVIVAAASIAIPSAAGAAVISFTDAAWSAANGTASYTVGTVTATAHPGGKSLTQSSTDGLGVSWILDLQRDEIDSHEWLTIDFGGSAKVESVTIANLYYERNCVFVFCGPYYAETGYYQVEDGAWTAFSAPASNAPNTGELTLDLGGLSTGWIRFSTQQHQLDLRHDFSVRAITVADPEPGDVPEPATMMLLGIGLLGGAMRLRRRS